MSARGILDDLDRTKPDQKAMATVLGCLQTEHKTSTDDCQQTGGTRRWMSEIAQNVTKNMR